MNKQNLYHIKFIFQGVMFMIVKNKKILKWYVQYDPIFNIYVNI